MEVYIDIIFIVNFLLTFTFLYFSTILVKLIRKPKIYRMILSSFVTSIVFIIYIYFELVFLPLSLIFLEFALSLSIIVAFYPLQKKEFLKLLYILHIITFSFGGLLYGLINLFSGLGLVGTKTNVSLKLFISGTAIMYIVLKLLYEFLKDIKQPQERNCKIEIHHNGKAKYLEGFVDTGNSLLHNGKRVNVIDISQVEKLFTEDINKQLTSTEIEKTEEFNNIFYKVIFTSVNNSMDSLYAFTCEEIIIDGKIFQNEILGVTKGLHSKKIILNREFGRIL